MTSYNPIRISNAIKIRMFEKHKAQNIEIWPNGRHFFKNKKIFILFNLIYCPVSIFCRIFLLIVACWTFVVTFEKYNFLNFFEITQNYFAYVSCLSNQISLRGYFVFRTNGRISSITSNIDLCCSFVRS